MSAAKIRAIKELVATPIKMTPNLEHIYDILTKFKDGDVQRITYGDGFRLRVSISPDLYRSLSDDTANTLSKMGVQMLTYNKKGGLCGRGKLNLPLAGIYLHRVSVECDKSGVLDVDTSVLDELDK